MLEWYWFFLIAGIAGGVLLGLIGVGMALITVPVLMLVLPQLGFSLASTPQIALATSMVVVSIGSCSAVWAQHKKGQIQWHLIWLMLPFSLLGIGVGTLLVHWLPAKVLTLLFALFLGYMAWTMLRPTSVELRLSSISPALHRGAATLIGLVGGLIGAGGGVLMVPWLKRAQLTMQQAVATSVMLGFPLTILASVFYLSSDIDQQQAELVGSVYWPAALLLSGGAALAAPVGVKLAAKVPAAELKRLFAVMLLLVAFQLLYKSSATIGL